MLNTLRRRYPLVEVVLSPAAVQGEAAPGELMAALKRLNDHTSPDVILLGRGGGSIEDLWAFNDEGLARAVAASEAPVISGVGHETDFTITDFVADLRAPTPTAAAELAVPDRLELRTGLLETRQYLSQLMAAQLSDRRWQLNELRSRLVYQSPQHRLRMQRQRLDEMNARAAATVRHYLQLQQARLTGLHQRLNALSPEGVLKRGFSVVTRNDGSLVSRREHVQPGDALRIRVQDGQINAEVKEQNEGEK
jgi:exodeoxyribonuclease VII large subunit